MHVGRIDGRPFSLLTLKRLATLLWLAESQLRSIRDPFSPNYNNIYTWGAEQRRYSRLAKALENGENLSHYYSGTDDTVSEAYGLGMEKLRDEPRRAI